MGQQELRGEHAVFSWEAEEARPKRNADWFWTVGTLSAAGAFAAAVAGNWLFAILLLLAGASVILSNMKDRSPARCALTRRGVIVNTQFFPYNNLTSFWIEEGPDHDSLLLVIKGALVPHLALPLPRTMTDPVRAHMKRFVSEIPHEKTFAEALGDRLGL